MSLPSKKISILAVDDDPQTLRLLRYNLEGEGYVVNTAGDGLTALRQVQASLPDLLILDVMMPELNGFEVCRRVRQESQTLPIILLTAKDEEEDKVQGLNAGADDYLTKPFGDQELLARVRAILRRSSLTSEEKTRPLFGVGGLAIDFRQHLVTLQGKEVKLTPTEYQVLSYLAQNAGRTVTQQDLLNKVWGPEYRHEFQILRVYIARIRRKIEEDSSHPRYIITKLGIGYNLLQPPDLNVT